VTRKGIIEQTKPQGCDLCGEVKELRPYGPNGEWVCFPCGMKDEAAAIRAFAKMQGWEPPKEGAQSHG